MTISSKQISIFSLFLIFTTVTIGYSSTTKLHQEYIDYFRYSSAVVIAICLVIFLYLERSKGGLSSFAVFTIFFYTSIIFYGIFMSVVFGGIKILMDTPRLGLFLILSAAFSFFLAQNFRFILDHSLEKYLKWYFLAGSAAMYMVGGVSLSFPPVFKLDYFGNSIYSQGLTTFFGMGATTFLISFVKKDNPISLTSIIYFSISILFLFFSFSGGARGNFVISFLIYLFILIYFRPKLVIFIIVPATAYAFFYLPIQEYWSEFVIVQRFLILIDGGFGRRGILWEQSLDLIGKEPICLLTGCGINYFQSYWGYPFGLYPHNLFLENLISFGAPITLILFLGGGVGMIISFFDWGKQNAIYYIALIELGISFKSGSVFGMVMLPFLIFFAVIAYSRIFDLRFIKTSRIQM